MTSPVRLTFVGYTTPSSSNFCRVAGLTEKYAGPELPVREHLRAENLPVQRCKGALQQRSESFQSSDAWRLSGQEYYRLLWELYTGWNLQCSAAIRRSRYLGRISSHDALPHYWRRHLQNVERRFQPYQSLEIDPRRGTD